MWHLLSSTMDRDLTYPLLIFSVSPCDSLHTVYFKLFKLKASLKNKKERTKATFFADNNSFWQVAVDFVPTVRPKKIISRIWLTLEKYAVTSSTVVMLNFPS